MPFPITRISLFKHGVACFERSGEIADNSPLELYFSRDQISDVLKSLTIEDISGDLASISYQVTPINNGTNPTFNSSSANELLNMREILNQSNSLAYLLAQLKGVPVRIAFNKDQNNNGDTAIEGIVVTSEYAGNSPFVSNTTINNKNLMLTLLVKDSIRVVDFNDVSDFCILDEKLQSDFQHLLQDLLAVKREGTMKFSIFVQRKQSDDKKQKAKPAPIKLTYIIRHPVWRTSYRIILPQQPQSSKPAVELEGWGIIDNPSQDDWNHVHVTLASAMSVSFPHDLVNPAEPRPPPQQGKFVFAPTNKVANKGKQNVYKSDWTQQTICAEQNLQAETPDVPPCEYVVPVPVTVIHNQSAMVPLFKTSLEGERVAIYNQNVNVKHPLVAVHIESDLKQPLLPGPITIYQRDSETQYHYVGESTLELLKPCYTAIIPYAVEIGAVLTSETKVKEGHIHKAVIRKGKLLLFKDTTQTVTYKINNKTGKAMELFLEHAITHESPEKPWELSKEAKTLLCNTSKSYYRFRILIESGQTRTFVVKEVKHSVTKTYISSVDPQQAEEWLQKGYIDGNVMKTLQQIMQLGQDYYRRRNFILSIEREVNQAFLNQVNLRQRLQSTPPGHVFDTLAASLAQEEARLARFKEEIKQLEDEELAKEDEWRTTILGIDHEVDIPTPPKDGPETPEDKLAGKLKFSKCLPKGGPLDRTSSTFAPPQQDSKFTFSLPAQPQQPLFGATKPQQQQYDTFGTASAMPTEARSLGTADTTFAPAFGTASAPAQFSNYSSAQTSFGGFPQSTTPSTSSASTGASIFSTVSSAPSTAVGFGGSTIFTSSSAPSTSFATGTTTPTSLFGSGFGNASSAPSGVSIPTTSSTSTPSLFSATSSPFGFVAGSQSANTLFPSFGSSTSTPQPTFGPSGTSSSSASVDEDEEL
jgi:hypothetical protein